jgi:hypothetical protein
MLKLSKAHSLVLKADLCIILLCEQHLAAIFLQHNMLNNMLRSSTAHSLVLNVNLCDVPLPEHPPAALARDAYADTR